MLANAALSQHFSTRFATYFSFIFGIAYEFCRQQRATICNCFSSILSLAANPLQRAANETHIAHTFCTVSPTVVLGGGGKGGEGVFLRGKYTN